MNPLLFGHNTEERIVGVQPLDDATMRLWVRTEEGVHSVDESFYPFLFLSDRTLLDGFPRKHWVKKLDGTLHYPVPRRVRGVARHVGRRPPHYWTPTTARQ